ncbi:MAG: threonylcarbamoyl-AMP synthase [Christensenellaceae bacterium]|jgi:L-threonylcarbamoyladenylate synthase|nr:threonylcarbamoyl-AMP synthase [Christensenellaceae bacterium]
MMNTIIGGIEKLKEAARLIRKGEIVAFPTETVYGLGADAFNASACLKIFEAKGRPADNPFIVHIEKIDDLDRVAKKPSGLVLKLFEKFAPGPLTLILNKRSEIPEIVTAGLDTIGVRIPNHKMALALISEAKTPIAAPSANVSGSVSPTIAQHVYEYMKGRINLILDGGACSQGIESTIVDMTSKIPTILRPGSISKADLLTVLDIVDDRFDANIDKPMAPGMKYKHYAPTIPCACVASSETAKLLYESNVESDPVIIASTGFISKFDNKFNCLSLGLSYKENSAKLYAQMKKAEKQYGYIILQYFDVNEGADKFSGLNNRIIKACGGNLFL